MEEGGGKGEGGGDIPDIEQRDPHTYTHIFIYIYVYTLPLDLFLFIYYMKSLNIISCCSDIETRFLYKCRRGTPHGYKSFISVTPQL